ncbi:hypothetical protein CPZ26_011910 [Raoultella ornithinolytica]|nr:hypothetical protein CEG93_14140 [Raoultella ornithinolytica]PJF14419.1 hypothetical protein CU101_11050 [Raoultella ornithinolytica]PJO27850.1 hypothetical protein CPZ26_011910 [Raoultella ornithinolytica]
MLVSLKPGGAHNDISLNALQGGPKGERSESNPHVPGVSSGFSALCGVKLPAPITPTYCSNTRRLARCDIEIPVTIPHSRSHAKAPERALHSPFSTGLRI